MIIKSKSAGNFTVIHNEIFEQINDGLAIGILVYLLSLPHDWIVQKQQLYKHFTQGRKAIDNAFKILETSGYIIGAQGFYENKKFTGWVWTVFDKPDPVILEKYLDERLPTERLSLYRQSTKEQLLNTNILNTIIQKKENNNNSSEVEKFDFNSLLQTINKYTNREYRVINSTVRKSYAARLRDGYTKEQILTAIKTAVTIKNHKENGFTYLTPEFFSRASTLDKYGTAVIKSDSNTNSDDYIPTI